MLSAELTHIGVFNHIMAFSATLWLKAHHRASGARTVLGVDGDGPHKQAPGGGRYRQPHAGDGATGGASGGTGARTGLCATLPDGRLQSVYDSLADPLRPVGAPSTPADRRPHAQAALDTASRVALRPGGQVVPASAPCGRHTPR